MRELSFIVSIWISFSASTLEASHSAMITQEPSYRLLHSSILTVGGAKVAGYTISVDDWLDRERVEKLVCHVLLKEKLPTSDMVSIGIYHMLDEYRLTGGLPQPKLLDHDMAQYIWNTNPAVSDRIVLTRDIYGARLNPPEAYEFDHTKGCGQSRSQ
jgi:hypothetical protein